MALMSLQKSGAELAQELWPAALSTGAARQMQPHQPANLRSEPLRFRFRPALLAWHYPEAVLRKPIH